MDIFDLPRLYLRPALLGSLLSVWVLVGLFFYLNAYTRRRYFTIWSAGWLFYALWLTLSLDSDTPVMPGMLLVKQCCVGFAGTFLLWGAAVFLKEPVSDRSFGALLAFIVGWSYVSAYYVQGLLWVQLPLSLLIGLGSGFVAFSFWRFRREHPYVGASLLSLGFALWGAYLACYPLWQASDELVTSGFFISAVLQLFIAVSMIILVLEEGRTTNQEALRQIEVRSFETADLRGRIQSTEERYRSLFSQASEGIVIVAANDLKVLELNDSAQRLFGIVPGSDPLPVLDSFIRLPCSLEPRPETGLEWFAALSTIHRIEIVRPDGSVVPAEVAGAPVAVDGLTAYQFFFREVTERVRLEQQLRQTEKLSALGQMISGIAHELNNPLAIIKGYLDLILARHDLGPQTRADLDKVAHEGNRAAKLVSNFLSFARERPAQRQSMDLNGVVGKAVELRELEFRLLGVQLKLDLDPNLPETEADAAQIEQVLVILINNSLHALAEWPNARRIKITTAQLDDKLLLKVEDSGPGIPASVLPHIFEPFFTTKPVGSGTGLGLSIAHSIAAEHRGRIQCVPSSQGGAAFALELPLIQPVADPVRPEQSAALAEQPTVATESARILVLDDEEVLAELLAELLTMLGHQPVICCSPHRALELISEQSFDLILSDFRMPRMNGREFYERVRQEHPDLAAGIVFLTGDVVSGETRQFLESVGNPFLSKPFRLEGISKVVSEMLARGDGPAWPERERRGSRALCASAAVA